MIPHEELLKIENAICRFKLCAYLSVGGWKKRGFDAERPRHLRCHLSQSQARAQQLSTCDVGGQISIAETEPVGHSVTLHLLQTTKCFIAKSPTAFCVECA